MGPTKSVLIESGSVSCGESGVLVELVQHRRLLRTLHGLADIAIVQSYLSAATKWDLDQHDTLYQLVTPAPGYQQRPKPAECLPLAVLQMKRRSLRTAVTDTSPNALSCR